MQEAKHNIKEVGALIVLSLLSLLGEEVVGGAGPEILAGIAIGLALMKGAYSARGAYHSAVTFLNEQRELDDTLGPDRR